MKRIFALFMCLMLTLTLFACGDDVNPTENNEKLDEQINEEDSNDDTVEDMQSEQAYSQSTGSKNILRENYETYSEMESAFLDHVLDKSKDHEVVSVSISTVTPAKLKVLNYLLPLSILGSSYDVSGEFDKNYELIGFKAAWADDADINYDGAGNYELSGTDRNGDKIKVKIAHDAEADSIRLEGYKNDDIALVFEYVKTADGYAAQYYLETTTGSVRYQPIVEFCTYKLLFDGTNGSYARFDGVESQPASIYCNAPDANTFIEGATHWLTITDGQFTGNIHETEF